jgi:Flp pilus assembly protein TadG
MVLSALLMVPLLVIAGLVIDIGHTMLVQRQLQAGVDAAALAGAQHLPIQSEVRTVATQYGPSPGRRNAVSTVDNATTTVTIRCITGVPGCSERYGTVNALTVTSRSRVPTFFGKLVGVNSLEVDAKATACSPCTSKPLDIMVVLDRTGSMCQFSDGSSDSNCTDLKNAREGIKTFLSYMDPTIDKVGLAVFPPSLNQSYVTSCPNKPWSGNPSGPTPDGKYYGYDAYYPYWIPDPRGSSPAYYTIASLTQDYLVKDTDGNWMLNPASGLIQRLDCVDGAGSTSYALSIEEAQHELDRNGRGGVQDVIVFFSDGAANTSPQALTSGHWTNNASNRISPCGTGVQSAAIVKGRGTIVYTIGYDVGATGSTSQRCAVPDTNGHQDTSSPVNEACGSWGCTAYDALRAMATSTDNFYNKPNPGELNQIFTRIAADINAPSARLIDNDLPDLVE